MMAVNIANGLLINNVESYICSTRLEGVLKNKIDINVGYLFLNKKKVIDINALRKLDLFVKNNDINIIHAHGSSYFTAALLKVLNSKLKLVWHMHLGSTATLPFYKKTVLKICSLFFSSVITVNKKLDTWSQNNLNAKKYYKLSNYAILNSKHIKNTVLKGVNRKRVVCLANLRPEKDHLNLIHAFTKVQNQFPDWTLHIVGSDNKDVYSDKVKSLIRTEYFENSVFLYDSRMDIANILEQSSIGVLSSKSEGLPVALLEYGLAKLPVVVTDVGDCKEVVNNNINGFLIASENKTALADKIIELILSAEKRNIFGPNLYAKVIEDYTENKYLEELLKIYDCA